MKSSKRLVLNGARWFDNRQSVVISSNYEISLIFSIVIILFITAGYWFYLMITWQNWIIEEKNCKSRELSADRFWFISTKLLFKIIIKKEFLFLFVTAKILIRSKIFRLARFNIFRLYHTHLITILWNNTLIRAIITC
jgi:hypothetical protein